MGRVQLPLRIVMVGRGERYRPDSCPATCRLMVFAGLVFSKYLTAYSRAYDDDANNRLRRV